MIAVTIIGWLCAVLISLSYSYVLATYMFLLHMGHESFFSCGPSVVFVALFAICIGFCIGIDRLCRKRKADPRGIWRSTVMVLLIVLLVWLFRDAPPLENDYSLQDIVTHEPEILASYDTLMTLQRRNAHKVDIAITRSNYAMILTNASAHAETINSAWETVAEVRTILEKLDQFPGIADLTPETQLGFNTPIVDFTALRPAAWAYGSYAVLLTEQGRPAEAVRHLAQLHSVTRKALPHMSLLIDKFIWIATANVNMRAAFAIMQHPNCTRETLELLKASFPPLSQDDVSMRRVFIAEYVLLKSISESALTPGCFSDWFGSSGGSTLFRRPAPLIGYAMFKKNRTFRDLRKFCDLQIEGAAKHPPDMAEVDAAMTAYCAKPDIRNMDGWNLIAVAMPSYVTASKLAVRARVLSELLFVNIGKHLGDTVLIQDYYSDGPYKFDEQTGNAFSVGPDATAHTDDDIALGQD